MLPNLIVIGAAKCGTTSLHHYLDRHPDVWMAHHPSGSKELRYFDRPDWREQLDWYSSLFPENTPIRGDATPRYTFHPHFSGVAGRIHSLTPDAKLIYLVRDPIDRIVSHWTQRYAGGDRRSFEDWMSEYEKPDNLIVCPSRYATQIEQYLELFPAEQLLVLDQEDLRGDRAATLRRVFEFLGVDADFESPAFDEQRNTSTEKVAPARGVAPLWDRATNRSSTLGRAVQALPESVRRPARRAASSLVMRKVDAPSAIDPALRANLTKLLQGEADRFRELTGRSFDHWSL